MTHDHDEGVPFIQNKARKSAASQRSHTSLTQFITQDRVDINTSYHPFSISKINNIDINLKTED